MKFHFFFRQKFFTTLISQVFYFVKVINSKPRLESKSQETKSITFEPGENNLHRISSLSIWGQHLLTNWEFFFFVGGVAGHLEKWSISSPIRVQIAQKLVRLLTLIRLSQFLMHIVSPKSLKKFSWTTFQWSVLRRCMFLVVIRLF